MIVRIKHTYMESVDFILLDTIPKVWDQWVGIGYKEAYIFYIRCVNDRIAETPSGNPTYDYDFYDIYIGMEEDTFVEHICIKRKEV